MSSKWYMRHYCILYLKPSHTVQILFLHSVVWVKIDLDQEVFLFSVLWFPSGKVIE